MDCYADDKSDSCVVVYRAYGNSTLNVIYGNTVSITLTLETGNYSFAIFRRTGDSDIDERPFISRMIVVGETEPSPPPLSCGTGKFEIHVAMDIYTRRMQCIVDLVEELLRASLLAVYTMHMIFLYTSGKK